MNSKRTPGSRRGLLGLLGALVLCLGLTGCLSPGSSSKNQQAQRFQAQRGTFGTYDAEPRQPNGRVDVERLINELVTIKARTYNFLVWRAANDWEDLQLFLPRAREHHIQVWVTLVPPSESPPHSQKYSEPFRLDYQRWAVEIAKLSLREPSLIAWSLDDFSYSASLFTPQYVGQMIQSARAINPQLAFIPCLYFGHITPALAEKYRPYVDGILFPYRHEMGKRNASEWDTLEAEVAVIKQRFGAELPVFVDVYATKHSQMKDSTPEYVDQVMRIARRCADGVLIYCHQYESTSPEKYRVVKALFNQWSSEVASP